jgi:hypothetical protein
MTRNPFRLLLIGMAMMVGVLGGLIGLAPPGLYALGLSHVNGRPSPPASCHPTPADRARLERAFRVSSPVTVQPLTPWAYVTFVLADSQRDGTAGGIDAAWLVAQHYNARHLADRHSISWHLSGAALTIWITRHWNSDEVLCAAVNLLRQPPTARPTSIGPD